MVMLGYDIWSVGVPEYWEISPSITPTLPISVTSSCEREA
jgi:hypothetical protein